MLVIEQLTKVFGDLTAVDGVSLAIPKGQMVGVIGRSGAGKSTLLRMVNRLTDPSRGTIINEGRDITALSGRDLRLWRASCAMIFQQFNLVERMDVLTNVMIGRIAHTGLVRSMARSFTDTDRARAIEALDRLDLVPQALQRAGTLSGGQQQRVAIAKALVQNPRIMLADEPIASLDPANASRVMEALREINKTDGLTVLVNLHTLDTARAYCDRIIAMRAGRVQFDGAPETLTTDRVRQIYGTGDLSGDIDEAVTSTSLTVQAPPQHKRAVGA
ncbi:phosphonate ABC transporter ATP-binding protein [Roseibium salinum]|uniref:Phosphonate ABC transporter ATP-binding protein n=1 Tax=Roseibium salinum TaxID=1604349 RepID=A0ABT3QZ91_9HYPH|nr:phosphonate ABC transporter ATP-binding protein [Roseibium sp. DSM 29163]MCX2722278.1 phosphonate ABC transporter ATP-binding protein [Roseibium sp. DSM 29163]